MTSLSNTTTFTNETFEESSDEVSQYEETPLRVFRLSFFPVIIIAGLIGKSVVFKVTWKKPLRNPFSFHLVANIAFAEILSSLCLFVMMVCQLKTDARFSSSTISVAL